MNPLDKMEYARANIMPVVSNKKTVVNGVKISKEARKLVSTCLLHQGINISCPSNADNVIPKDKILGAIHELAHNSMIANEALTKNLINKVSSLEGCVEEALNTLLELAQHAVDQQDSAELTLDSLQRLTDKLDTQYKAVAKVKAKIGHLHIDKLADDIDKLAQAVSNPLVAELLGLGKTNDD